MKRRFTENSWRKDSAFRALCTAFLQCQNEGEIAEFLRDIATLSEMKALCERLEVAKELTKGVPYRIISQKTGASTATVTRIARFVESGKGYQKVIKAQTHHHAHSSARRGRVR